MITFFSSAFDFFLFALDVSISTIKSQLNSASQPLISLLITRNELSQMNSPHFIFEFRTKPDACAPTWRSHVNTCIFVAAQICFSDVRNKQKTHTHKSSTQQRLVTVECLFMLTLFFPPPPTARAYRALRQLRSVNFPPN